MTVGELENLVAERVERGECGCGCGGAIPVPKAGKKQRQKFLPDHRQRLYKRKVQVTATEKGLEPRLSLRTLNPPDGTKDCSRYAQSQGTAGQTPKSKPRKPSGAQVSYFKAIDTLAAYFENDCGEIRADAHSLARDILRPALPAKQRERLDRSIE